MRKREKSFYVIQVILLNKNKSLCWIYTEEAVNTLTVPSLHSAALKEKMGFSLLLIPKREKKADSQHSNSYLLYWIGFCPLEAQRPCSLFSIIWKLKSSHCATMYGWVRNQVGSVFLFQFPLIPSPVYFHMVFPVLLKKTRIVTSLLFLRGNIIDHAFAINNKRITKTIKGEGCRMHLGEWSSSPAESSIGGWHNSFISPHYLCVQRLHMCKKNKHTRRNTFNVLCEVALKYSAEL